LSTEQVTATLANHLDVQLAIVFGSVAQGSARHESDVGVAIQAARSMNAEEKLQLIGQPAAATGRPLDFIDLRTVGEPLLGQILKHGR
jgi:predicted nucleotidyltransferase